MHIILLVSWYKPMSSHMLHLQKVQIILTQVVNGVIAIHWIDITTRTIRWLHQIRINILYSYVLMFREQT